MASILSRPQCVKQFWHIVYWTLRHEVQWNFNTNSHYSDVTMGMMASQITSFTIVYSTVFSGADQRKHQSSALLAFVRGIHRQPVNSPHKWPITQKLLTFDDDFMQCILFHSGKCIWNCRLKNVGYFVLASKSLSSPPEFWSHMSPSCHPMSKRQQSPLPWRHICIDTSWIKTASKTNVEIFPNILGKYSVVWEGKTACCSLMVSQQGQNGHHLTDDIF